jgi:uncharacterized glyoxalase superfamily protein PhnB
MKITPILTVDRIEVSLPFWVERMGFQKTVEMPDGDRLGFVILSRNGSELMLQTPETIRKDEPKFAPTDTGTRASLFIEVDDFADTTKRLNGYPIAMPQRDTFYGMREVGVFEPSGHIIIFAAPSPKP